MESDNGNIEYLTYRNSSGEKTMTRTKIQNGFFIIISVVICLMLAAYLGVLPFCTLPTLDFNISLVGQIANFKGNLPLDFSFTGMMYPFGSEVNEGFAIYFFARMFYGMGFSALDAITLTYFLLFAIGFFAMILVVYRITKRAIVSLVLSVAYFISPIVGLNCGIPQMYFGVMLMPLQVFVDLVVFEYMQDNGMISGKRIGKKISHKSVIVLCTTFLARFLMAAVGWYTAVISAVLSCFFFLLYFVFSKEKFAARIRAYLLYIILPWFLGMLLIMLQMPKRTSSFAYRMEFFYAASLDIITLFSPIGAYKISDCIPFLRDHLANNGQVMIGGDIQYCYLGFACVVAAVILLLCNRKKAGKEKKILMVSALLLLVLAIGPGFRFAEMLSAQEVSGYASYFMEKEKVLSLPWGFLYKVFPLKSMRTVYRWFYGTRMAAFLLVALAFGELADGAAERKRIKNLKTVIAYGLVLLCFFENVPSNMSLNLKDSYKTNAYNVLKNVYPEEICSELKDVIKQEDALVAICTYDYSSNGILTPFLVSGLDIRTYAGCGDKGIEMAEPYYPSAVWKLQRSDSAEKIIQYTEIVSKRGLCDYVILPYYSLRDAGYYWPVSEEMQNRLMAICSEVETGLQDRYSIVKTPHYMVIDLTNERSENSFDINTENVDQGIVKDTNFGDDRYSILINGGNICLQIDTREKDMLYLLGYVKSYSDAVDFTLLAYDVEGNAIGQMMEAVDASGNYEKYEREIELPENVASVAIYVTCADQKALLDSLHAAVYE